MSDSDYTDVSAFIPNWNARSTGSTKEGNRKSLEAGPDSWIEGYFMGTRKQVINGDEYTIHKMKVLNVGNEAHLQEPLSEKGKEYEFFGASVVNSQLVENIAPGTCVKIIWLGLQQPKKANGREYQGWKTLINNSVAPISVLNSVGVAAPVNEEAPATPKTEGAANTAAIPEGGADDDLPF